MAEPRAEPGEGVLVSDAMTTGGQTTAPGDEYLSARSSHVSWMATSLTILAGGVLAAGAVVAAFARDPLQAASSAGMAVFITRNLIRTTDREGVSSTGRVFPLWQVDQAERPVAHRAVTWLPLLSLIALIGALISSGIADENRSRLIAGAAGVVVLAAIAVAGLVGWIRRRSTQASAPAEESSVEGAG